MRAGYSNRPTGRCKSRKSALPKIGSTVASPPQRFVPPTNSEKARRIAELRVVLADAAPLFQARTRHQQEGGRS